MTLPLSTHDPNACAHCYGPLDLDTDLKLWDGYYYCFQCVHAASPGVADHARVHTSLECTISADTHACLAMHATSWLLAMLITLFAWTALTPVPLLGALAFLAPFACIIAVLDVACTMLVLRYMLPRHVAISDGRVIVSSPLGQSSVPLAGCRWRIATTLNERTPVPFCVRPTSALLICPPGVSRRTRFIACVGSTNLHIWADFLSFVEIERL